MSGSASGSAERHLQHRGTITTPLSGRVRAGGGVTRALAPRERPAANRKAASSGHSGGERLLSELPLSAPALGSSDFSQIRPGHRVVLRPLALVPGSLAERGRSSYRDPQARGRDSPFRASPHQPLRGGGQEPTVVSTRHLRPFPGSWNFQPRPRTRKKTLELSSPRYKRGLRKLSAQELPGRAPGATLSLSFAFSTPRTFLQ